MEILYREGDMSAGHATATSLKRRNQAAEKNLFPLFCAGSLVAINCSWCSVGWLFDFGEILVGS